jgi:hypothetical protein
VCRPLSNYSPIHTKSYYLVDGTRRGYFELHPRLFARRRRRGLHAFSDLNLTPPLDWEALPIVAEESKSESDALLASENQNANLEGNSTDFGMERNVKMVRFSVPAPEPRCECDYDYDHEREDEVVPWSDFMVRRYFYFGMHCVYALTGFFSFAVILFCPIRVGRVQRDGIGSRRGYQDRGTRVSIIVGLADMLTRCSASMRRYEAILQESICNCYRCFDLGCLY